MGIGSAMLGLPTALVVHAAVAPLIFAALSAGYFCRFADADPLATTAGFLAVVVAFDVVVFALFI